MVACQTELTKRNLLDAPLQQAQRMEAVGRLAAGIAHDFNNLLTVITGYADLLAETIGTNHPSRADIAEIQAAAQMAASLTHQLLAFSRRQVVKPRTLDVNEVLRRLEPMLGRVIGEHIVLETSMLALRPIEADPGQVEQLFLNLAANARDAMPDGGRLRIVTTDVDVDQATALEHPEARLGPHVLISVGDTGVGIDEATRAHLFEPFFTTKGFGKGTGLGLAWVYGIVTQGGGFIDVESSPGAGATFRIFLPASTGSIDTPLPSASVASLEGTETVLLLEDQQEVRDLAQRALRKHGYTVLTAATGDEALRSAREHEGPIHLLLTDVILPGPNGRAVARQVVAQRPTTRVIYMSGYTDDAIVQHGVFEPGLAFLQKPFGAKALARMVRQVLLAEFAPAV